jgi:hypothetical protein
MSAAEIAEMRRAIADLQHRVRELERRPVTIPRAAPQPAENGVRIGTMTPAILSDLPTVEQASQLCEIVWLKFPALRPARIDSDYASSVRMALAAIGALGRAAVPDKGKAWTWWVDEAEEVLRAGAGITKSFESTVFATACVAACNVPFTAWSGTDRGPILGLSMDYAHPVQPAWRELLAGEVPVPDPVSYPA